MRVALYHRVSTLDQDATNARDELRASAARMGGFVELDVEETGSGAKADRPGLARVMAAARAGQLDAVLVWKLDRFGRSTVDLLNNVNELRARGVRWIATSQGIDIGPASGALGNLLLTMLAGVAEFERELTRERTTLALDKARKAGKHIGRPRAQVSTSLAARASELRRQLALKPSDSTKAMPWRAVRRALLAEGFHNVPSVGTLIRAVEACPKVPPESAGVAPRPEQTSGVAL